MQDEMRDRVDNWARWARPRIKYHTCYSFEGKYKPPPVWHPPEPRIFVDVNDALKIERGLVHSTFPAKFRKLIVYEKIYSYIHPHKFCRKEKLNIRTIEEDTRMAYLALENVLRLEKN